MKSTRRPVSKTDQDIRSALAEIGEGSDNSEIGRGLQRIVERLAARADQP